MEEDYAEKMQFSIESMQYAFHYVKIQSKNPYFDHDCD